mgnify:CR=1 FL=1
MFIDWLVFSSLFFGVFSVPPSHAILDLFQANINAIHSNFAYLPTPSVNLGAISDSLLAKRQSAYI